MPKAYEFPPIKSIETPRSERRIFGLSASLDPQDAFPGSLTVADNIRVRWGKAFSRPGIAGMLDTPHTDPLYGINEYRNDDGTTSLLYDSGGDIYQNVAGASTDALVPSVPGAGTLNSAGAMWAQMGRWKYRVAPNDPLLRIDPTGGTAKTALLPPTDAPAVQLTSVTLDSLLTTAHWQADTLTSAQTNQVVNGSFSGGTGGSQAGWTNIGPSVDFHNPSPSGGVAGTWDLVDDPGEGIISTAFIANFAQTLGGGRMASQFLTQVDAFNMDGQGRGGFVQTVIAYDAGGNELTRLTKEISPGNTGARANTYTTVFSFGELGVPIAKWKLQLAGSITNQLGNDSVYIGNIVGYPTVAPITFTAGQFLQASVGDQGEAVGTMHLAGTHLRYTPAAPIDLSRTNVISIGLAPQDANIAKLGFRLRLQQSGTTTWYDTNPVTLAGDGLSASVDVSAAAIPAAVLASVGAMEIVFSRDVTYTGPAQVLLRGLTGAGNLSTPQAGIAFAPYYYAYTEVDDAGDSTLVNVIESNPSPVTANLITAPTQAMGSVLLPSAPLNASTTHYRVYRFGGVFTDGNGRLIATVPLGADTPVLDADPGLVAWDSAAHTLTDNTPDQWLEVTSAELLDYGRDAPVAGAQAIAAWQGRVVIAKGGRLYLSWLVTQDAQAALYFNQFLAPDDPKKEIKGDTFNVGLDDNDPIQALIPLGPNPFFESGYLMILKRNSVYLLQGTNPTNFKVHQAPIGKGIGCAAPRAAALVGGNVWMLSDDGVYIINSQSATPHSVLIERAIAPPTMLGGNDPAAWAKSSLTYHDRRAYLTVPTPGDSAPTVTFVWDSRAGEQQTGGWTRDTGTAWNGGVTLSGGSAAGPVYFGGQDGQIYTLSGSLDKATPADSGTGVSYTIATRGLGQESDSLDYYREKQAGWMLLDLYTAQMGGAVHLALTGEGTTWSGVDYALSAAGGMTHARIDVPHHIRGRFLEMRLSGTATETHEVQAMGLTLGAGNLR